MVITLDNKEVNILNRLVNFDHKLLVDICSARVALSLVKPKIKDFDEEGAFAKRVAKKLDKSQSSLSGISWVGLIDLAVAWNDVCTAHSLKGLGGCDPQKFEKTFNELLDSHLKSL